MRESESESLQLKLKVHRLNREKKRLESKIGTLKKRVIELEQRCGELVPH